MNGITLNKSMTTDTSSTLLDQVKKYDDLKKRKNLKLIATILFSNIFVAYLFYTPTNSLDKTIAEKPKLLTHSGYQMMVLNIDPLMQFDEISNERKITLLNSKKKIILSLGYLHEEIKNEQDPSIRRFKIEIPNKQILDIGAFSEEKLVAIPAIEKTVVNKNIKESLYEINL